jgi:uncharacterized protein
MENSKEFVLSVLPEKMGICHLGKNSPIPGWVVDQEFFSVTRTKQELSIVCRQDKIPGGVLFEKDWRAFRVEDVPEILHSIGIVASLSKPLAEAGISIFNVSTYETNYILVEDKNFEKAKEVLSSFCQIN